MTSCSLPHKPHAVCVPFPTQSHIKAMLKLAKLLHGKGFHITFLNNEFNHKRFVKTRGSDSLNGFSDFQFHHIPDGIPASTSSEVADATQDLVSLAHSVYEFMLVPFCSLISKLNDSAAVSSEDRGDNIPPPVSCIVSDGFMPFAVKAAQAFGLPVVSSFSIAACSVMGYYQFRCALERGFMPLRDEDCLTNSYLDTKIDWIPGMKDIRLKDLPTIFRKEDQKDIIMKVGLDSVDAASKASAVLIQTFHALEVDVLDALGNIFPNLYSVGPLQLLLDEHSDSGNDVNSVGYSLWKEEIECLQWLDSKEPNSVLYVNFGSIVALSQEQLVEFCWGLADSQCDFLLIIRSDLIDQAILPIQFTTETEERCMVSGWCPQEQVLAHPSVGGFFTHCGWNSTVESLCTGVPMICCPFLGDQPTNCKYTCNEWEVGLEIDKDAKRDEVKRVVKEVIRGEEGRRMRRKALEWKKLAKDAVSLGGSSSINFDKLVKTLLGQDNIVI